MSKITNRGFPPVIVGRPKVIILGSMPGEESLRKKQYYANPRNLFWEIMGGFFHFNKDDEYKIKIKALTDNGVALWDVIDKCERKGSLDSAIKPESIVVNDFASLFSDNKSIRYVFFNGTKAEKEYQKRVLPTLNNIAEDIKHHLLPSTSPANAAKSKADKIKEWSKINTMLI
ncbi:MAG: DNA-deoxyinosine glycosylase [Gammaproteobacteria bacterium]